MSAMFVLVAFSADIAPFTEKMNGVSLVGTKDLIESGELTPINKLNANWVTVMPFGFIANNEANVRYNQPWQWKGETTAGIKHTIVLAKKNNLKILLKPHLWTHRGWIGDLSFDQEKDYNIFEDTYTKFILDFAKIAEETGVEVFCIGVELKKISVSRPNFFKALIEKVRQVYTGKLTYAANWDNYQNIVFWKNLDYIGIDAYFPISDARTPSYQACYMGWKPHYEAIKKLSKGKDKKVIFTEFGYRNIDFTAKEPWFEGHSESYNSTAQINAYRAIFARFWGETWFAGGFVWKWFPNHSNTGGTANNRFTPQNKPAENIIQSFYGKK
jgi:hypothetical protein